jgi:uracil-DNA glycosylase
MSSPEALLRAYLRQRTQLGERELVLQRLTPADLAAVLARPAPEAGGAARPAAAPVDPGYARTPRPPAGQSQPRAAPAPAVVLPASLELLRQETLACVRCGLAGTRSTVVFGEGDPEADLLVVGEAPGAEEDRTGRPFVGRAGKLLDLLLASAGFPRSDVFICNVLKCRPPANRNPEAVEVASCSPFLFRQIELVRPRAVLACGSFAAQTLLATTTSIGELRGETHEVLGVPLVATYHPAALLRNGGWIRSAWEDVQRLRSLLDASTAARA